MLVVGVILCLLLQSIYSAPISYELRPLLTVVQDGGGTVGHEVSTLINSIVCCVML